MTAATPRTRTRARTDEQDLPRRARRGDAVVPQRARSEPAVRRRPRADAEAGARTATDRRTPVASTTTLPGRKNRPAGRIGPSPAATRAKPSAAPTTPRSTLGVVVGVGETSVPRTPFVLLVIVLAAAGLIALVLMNTAINENAFRLHDLQTRQEALDQTEERLQRDVADAESPGSLAAAARRLGLVPAGEPAFIRLPSGQIVGVPTPARAAGSATARTAPARPAVPGPATRPVAPAAPPAGTTAPAVAP